MLSFFRISLRACGLGGQAGAGRDYSSLGSLWETIRVENKAAQYNLVKGRCFCSMVVMRAPNQVTLNALHQEVVNLDKGRLYKSSK